jgi:hypothetical protein
VPSVAAFQAAILDHLPAALRPNGPRDAALESVSPIPSPCGRICPTRWNC